MAFSRCRWAEEGRSKLTFEKRFMPSPRVATARELQFAQREITLSVAIHRWPETSVLFVKVRILWTRIFTMS
jgi:hypothetical protein